MTRKQHLNKYDINEFQRCSDVTHGTKYSHRVDLRTLEGSNSIFYCKEMKSHWEARLELLAQELFRVFTPNQPKTKLACSNASKTLYILSEAVKGYKPLREKPELFKNDHYTGLGLGQASVVSVYLQEIDFKDGNVGFDKEDNVIKIDGNWCFADLTDSDSFPIDSCKITKELLENLPFPIGFQAFNWLDIIVENINKAESSIVEFGLMNNEYFAQEVYQAIHKIILTPNIFLENIAESCFEACAESFLDFLISRRNTLKVEALKMAGFCQYLESKLSETTIKEHYKQLSTFVVNKEYAVISDDEMGKFRKDFCSQWESLGNELVFIKKITRIKSDLENSTFEKSKTYNARLFCIPCNSAPKEVAAKNKALELIETNSKTNEKLYRELYEILYKPFCNQGKKKREKSQNVSTSIVYRR